MRFPNLISFLAGVAVAASGLTFAYPVSDDDPEEVMEGAVSKVICVDRMPQVQAVVIRAFTPGTYVVDVSRKCTRST